MFQIEKQLFVIIKKINSKTKKKELSFAKILSRINKKQERSSNMHRYKWNVFCIFFLLISSSILQTSSNSATLFQFHPNNLEELASIFPHSAQELELGYEEIKQKIKSKLEQIYSITPGKRTFSNTIEALDDIKATISFLCSLCGILSNTATDKSLQKKASEIKSLGGIFKSEYTISNKKLYKSCKQYAENGSKSEPITDEQRYCLDEIMRKFNKNGLNLPIKKQNQIMEIKKELSNECRIFNENIKSNKSHITTPINGLDGLPKQFIENLPKTNDGKYVLKCNDYTRSFVLPLCNIEQTRKDFYIAFKNRAYPENKAILMSIIEKRNKFAEIVGYPDYASFDIDGKMAINISNIENFIAKLVKIARTKTKEEVNILNKLQPQTAAFTSNDTIKPWNIDYLKNIYKKKFFQVNETEISEYFCLEKIIDPMINILESFFNLRIEQEKTDSLWKNTVILKIHNRTNETLIGYLLLDLHSHPGKHTRGKCYGLVPTQRINDTFKPGVAVVLTSFAPKIEGSPSLLTRKDLTILFHEVGHALHNLLSETKLLSFAGSRTKSDFTEMPSQVLESMVGDKEILKMLSAHHKTGEQIPQKLIDSLTVYQKQKFGTGLQVMSFSFYSTLSIDLFKTCDFTDLDKISQEVYKKTTTGITIIPEEHFYTSFSHLIHYGAKYYNYLWTKVFAHDIVKHIRQNGGFLDNNIGQKYAQCILKPGGQKPPEQLLVDFLEREPTQEAFCKSMGLV